MPTTIIKGNVYASRRAEDVEDLKLCLIGYLDYKIPDPISRGDRWIFPSFPDIDIKRPAISITQVGADPNNDFVVGDGASMVVYMFDIEAFVDTLTAGTINSVSYTQSHLIDVIIDEIEKAIYRGRTYMKTNYNVVDMLIVNRVPFDYDNAMDNFRASIRVGLQIQFNK